MPLAGANGLRSAREASAKQTMSGGRDVSMSICFTYGSDLIVLRCLKRGKSLENSSQIDGTSKDEIGVYIQGL